MRDLRTEEVFRPRPKIRPSVYFLPYDDGAVNHRPRTRYNPDLLVACILAQLLKNCRTIRCLANPSLDRAIKANLGSDARISDPHERPALILRDLVGIVEMIDVVLFESRGFHFPTEFRQVHQPLGQRRASTLRSDFADYSYR